MNAGDACSEPVKAVLGLDLVCAFENEEIVRNMKPDQNLLVKIKGRIQNATARGKDVDCVSRRKFKVRKKPPAVRWGYFLSFLG